MMITSLQADEALPDDNLPETKQIPDGIEKIKQIRIELKKKVKTPKGAGKEKVPSLEEEYENEEDATGSSNENDMSDGDEYKSKESRKRGQQARCKCGHAALRGCPYSKCVTCCIKRSEGPCALHKEKMQKEEETPPPINSSSTSKKKRRTENALRSRNDDDEDYVQPEFKRKLRSGNNYSNRDNPQPIVVASTSSFSSPPPIENHLLVDKEEEDESKATQGQSLELGKLDTTMFLYNASMELDQLLSKQKFQAELNELGALAEKLEKELQNKTQYLILLQNNLKEKEKQLEAFGPFDLLNNWVATVNQNGKQNSTN
jgi:hypothetical protein